MLIDKKKFIFIQIPKTASDSIAKNLLSREGIYDFKSVNKSMRFGHISIHDILKYKPEAETYFKFCFVRNPYDRALSEYFYCKKHNGCAFPQPHIFQKVFPTFLHFLIRDGLDRCPYPGHAQSQYTYIKNHDDIYVGRFETLQTSFEIICKKIGIEPQELPHFNKTNHKHYSKYYKHPVARKIIEQRYAEDFKHFGYRYLT